MYEWMYWYLGVACVLCIIPCIMDKLINPTVTTLLMLTSGVAIIVLLSTRS